MIHAIEEILEKKAKINNLEMQLGDAPRTYSDNSSSRYFLNYSPKISFKNGLNFYFNYLEQNS